MTAVAKLGRLEIKFTGGATRAYDRACFSRDESVFAVVPAGRHISAMNPFLAISHEYRITNRIVIPCEEDSAIRSFAGTVAGERYRGPRGRLLTFKNAR